MTENSGSEAIRVVWSRLIRKELRLTPEPESEILMVAAGVRLIKS